MLDVGSVGEGSRFQVERCSADVVSSGMRVEVAKAGTPSRPPCPGSASLPSHLRLRDRAGPVSVGLSHLGHPWLQGARSHPALTVGEEKGWG